MNITSHTAKPPVTQLRPLHSYRAATETSTSESLNWTSTLQPTPNDETAIKAFVKLVSRLVILEEGETFCVQDSRRGGFILAHNSSTENDAVNEYHFVECHDGDIPSDFSIGEGKTLQLHIGAENKVQLTANANAIPAAALEALGCMLDDIITGLQQAQNDYEWSQPSVLNFPPKSSPLRLLRHDVSTQETNDENVPTSLLHHWFEQRVMESPQSVAIDYLHDLESGSRTQFTYIQINNIATKLAKKLVETCSQSLQSFKSVAVLMGPCPELYISYLAALKAGVAFCPVAVDAPEERKEALMADLKPSALLTTASSKMSDLSSRDSTEVIDVTSYLEHCDTEPTAASSSTSITENDVAYILYTSGTTGLPKGVAVSHLSAACTISSLSAHYGFTLPPPGSKPVRWFQGAAPTFDISLFEIFWTLSTGSTLCCAPRDFTLQDIDKVVTTLEADITNITPSFASLLDPSSIRGLMVGGETLSARLLQDFAKYNPVAESEVSHVPIGIFNGYGPTETAIYCIAQTHVPEDQRGSVIGTPLATCGVLIAEEQSRSQDRKALEPVPVGSVGELVITGPQVSKIGYLNRPDETATAFVDDSHWGRAYKTGDRARIVWDASGSPVVEFLGRISDDQVKLSGRRVELGEIESILASKAEGVKETLSCVWKQGKEAGSEKIISLVVVEPRSELSFESVRQKCEEIAQQHLPDYMRPFKILQVETLPRSASGKADRKAALAMITEILRHDLQPVTTQDELIQDIEPLARSEDAKMEGELVSIVNNVLRDGVPSGPTVRSDTVLAKAGMDSLRAMRILRDIRRSWPTSEQSSGKLQHVSLQPSLAQLLDEEATVRSVFFPGGKDSEASTASAKKEASARAQLEDFSNKHMSEAVGKLGLNTESDIEMILPATSTQSQLALSFAMDKRNYISHTVLRLRPDVSGSALKEAIEVVVSKQAIYRSAMLPCDDEFSPFLQVVLSAHAWKGLGGTSSRVVYGKTDKDSGDVQALLDLAEDNLSLESHKLYYIQVVESDDPSNSGLLIISAAHCICDGPSLEVLMSDISRQYSGLEPLSRQGMYDSVLDWASNVSPETDQLWQKALQDWETEPLGAISGNNVKPSTSEAKRQHAMVQHNSDIPWQVLETKSRALGASPLTILQAAWATLLHIMSEADTDDVTFGSVLSGHDQFVHAPTFSVVPCRVALPETQTLNQLVSSLMEHSRFAQSHRHTSFGVFKTLPYNTALALQAYPQPEDGQEEASAPLWTEISNPAIRYDFSMFAEVFPTNPLSPDRNGKFEDVVFKLTYRDETFSELSASCIAKQFADLTKTILDSLPGDLVQTLPAQMNRALLSAEGTIPVEEEIVDVEERQVRDRARLLHSQFEDQAASTPDLLALSFYSSLDSPPVELTYAELDARANGLANILREQDIDIIPICLERSIELYVAILAILKAGSAWCPIDTTSPVQRRTSLIARAQSKVLLTTTESLFLVEPCIAHDALKDVQVILVDQYAHHKSSTRAKPRESITSEITGQDLAYLLWTSGTTGEPKGVMIQHSAAAQAMRDLQVLVEHDDSEQVRTLQLSAYSFDVFVQDLFYTWGLAGSVISGTRELVLGTFTEFIWKSRPTHAHLTPSFGASIAVQELKGSTLQYVTFIGEKLTEDVAEAWAAPGVTTRAYNTYGPAENAVVSTMRRFYGKSRDVAKAANVGFPLDHCTAYVVREVECEQGGKRWELVPRYGVGELALGGAQVGKGYLSNEAKTTKAFIQGGPGIDERIYLTGDLVRLNDHGFEFLGRNDDLVKITGIRIELSEISAACASLKDDDAAVEHVETLYLQRPGAPAGNNNKVVVTFVSVKVANVDTAKIRSQVFKRAKDLLPAYMVPGHVVILDTTMPRTASNKVDRKALQSIYAESDLNVLAGRDGATHSTDDTQRPEQRWTTQQLTTLKVIAGNFNIPIENLSPDDSLAGLGLSSLQVTKLAWVIRRELKCQVGVLDLMRCESLGELVDVTLSRMPKDTVEEHPPREEPTETSWLAPIKDILTKNIKGDMRPQDTQHILPATPMQESLIVETMLEPQAYWAHRIFDLSHLDEVDDRQLKRAWTATAKRFDILRTVFVPLTQLDVEGSDNTVTWAREKGVQSTILQLIRDKPAVRWTHLSNEQDQTLSQLAKTLQSELSPTTTIEPPWAVTFVQDSNKVILSMHHALYDAVASETILETVSKLYHMESVGDLSEIVQFDRGLKLGLLPTPARREEAAAIWSRRLDDVSKTASGGMLNAPFPDLTQSRQKQVQKILLSRKEIPVSFTDAAPTVSLPTLLQSAFGCVLASYLELDSIVLGHTVSQRILHPDLARVVGPAIATLPLIIRSNASSARELWKDMASDSSQLFQSTHNLHPVDLKKMLNRGSGSSNTPFPGLFVYHPAPEDGQDDNAQHMFREIGQALSLNVEHPLALNIFEANGTVELTGDGRHIAQAQLDLLLDQVLDQARVMAEAPEIPLTQLHSQMSRDLLSVSGDIASEGGSQTNPADSVSLHASQHPDWIAAEEVFFQASDDGEEEIITKTITYAQLDKLTNTIVTRLIEHEVQLQPDDPVAMCLGRDIKSLAVTLAIFRAGFVYLPVDEDLPSARKQLLIRDAGAKLVITTQELLDDLDLDASDDPPVLLIPNGVDDLDSISSWAASEHRHRIGDGGYLLYTSGSTGRPKGVRVSNNNLCHFIAAFSNRMIEHSPATAKLGGVGKYLNLTSRAFDPHLTQLFVPWHFGHRVVIGTDRTAMLANLKELINELSITHFGSVPSVLSQLRLRPEDVPSVRVVTTGGEKASNDLLDTWARVQDSNSDDTAVLFNFYGPTEVTIGCLGHAVHQDSNARNLGLPLQGLEALLLCPNAADELVVSRRGQPGELCIAGPQVAMGYLNRPAEQAKSFQTISIFGSTKRVYRTGDMMRMMNDGSLEFLGRADQQTKIRGQRLELDEVVGFLKQAAGDESDLEFAAIVASIGDDSSNQQQQLLGFVARKPKSPKAHADVEAEVIYPQDQDSVSVLETIELECQAKLPAFMVPTLLWVTKTPYLAASGKVDTKILTRLANDFLATQRDEDADDSGNTAISDSICTLSANESQVAAALEQVVGGSVKATPTSSIHRLGIDSLSAVNLVSLLRKRGFSQLKMTHVLSPSCTVGDIARLADQDSTSSNSSTPLSTPPSTDDRQVHRSTNSLTTKDLGPFPESLDETNIEAVLPCLPLQSALIARSLVWLSAYSEAGGAAGHDVPYVAQFSYRLDQGTDIDTWKKVAEDVINSEAMLRTCFIQREEDGQIFQVVLRSPPASPLSDEDPADIVGKMNVRPPIRLQVLEGNGSDGVIVTLKIHHALFDGVAIDALKNRLEQGYKSQTTLTSQSDTLDTLSKVSNYCALSGEQLESTQRAWQAELGGVQPCRVGTLDDNTTNGTMARSTLRLGYTTTELNYRLKSQSQGVSISTSAAFQLATGLCLAQLTQQPSVVYGFIMSLRPLLDHVAEGIDTFVGPCLNTLIKTLTLQSQDETLPQLAQRVHQTHLDVCQGTMPLVSVEKVQRWSGSEDKLFDSLLSINPVAAKDQVDGEHSPGHMVALPTRSSSDMALAIDVDLLADGGIVLTLSSAGALSESQLEDVGRLFEKIVFSCADNAVKVSDMLPSLPMASIISPHAKSSRNSGSRDTPTTEGQHQKALADVKATIGRLLRLDQNEVASKPESTSLYQLGLDSITVLPFVKLINKSNKTKLSSHAVIKARTIRGVAELLAEAQAQQTSSSNGDGRNSASPGKRDDTRDVLSDGDTYDKTLERLAKDLMFVATPLQEGMLSASLATGGDAYTYVHAIQLSEAALAADTHDLDGFFAAVRDTVKACEILRTRFIFTEDDESPWVGIVSPTEQSDLVSWDVQSATPGRVHLRIHHALYDATSIHAVWSILEENYHRRLNNENPHGLTESKHLFRPFAKTVSSSQRSSVAFWTTAVRGYTYTPLDFPSDKLKASAAFHFTLDEQELSLLQSRCKDLGVTIKAALQLAWAKVLCETLYNQADVVYGEVVSTDADDDKAIVGPTINTLSMRVKLSGSTSTLSVSEALELVQKQIDSARGTNSMASLRKVQTQWRSDQQGDVPAGLFQSLFVFDGVVGSSDTSDHLFAPAKAESADVSGPAYDDYPLIVSFHIKNNTLNGKLRAKMSPQEVDVIGGKLAASLNHILHGLESPVLDTKHLALPNKVSKQAKPTTDSAVSTDMNGLTPTADAVLSIVEKVIGNRRGSKKIGYGSRLISVGLDSIVAIRLSKLLKDQIGLSVSVFDIMKGASVHDIVTHKAISPKTLTKRQERQPAVLDAQLKTAMANTLELPEGLIKSILPVLSGQRAHLEQWLHNGKRFFEPPWVYRVDDSFDVERLETCWAELVRVHDILRTTFASGENPAELYQVTLGERWSARKRFTPVVDSSRTIEALVAEHVGQENALASDLKKPPARFSFLEAADGKAVVLRLHHALYDAWSIKMIESDLNDLLSLGTVQQTRPSLEQEVQKIKDTRQPEAEKAYWKSHLFQAQETILGSAHDSSAPQSIGPQFKASYSSILPQTTLDSLTQKSNSQTSSAIILAYAKTLKHFTERSRPTFGLNHASRSLSSPDGTQSLDLTGASMPTLTVTPLSVDLESSDGEVLGFIQDHFAQLTCFAQADGVSKIGPRFNSYVNIIHRDDTTMVENGNARGETKALKRYRLPEPLASDYFTVAAPSSVVSTVDQLDSSHLSSHRFFFNVIVSQGQGVTVTVSGDKALFGGDEEAIPNIVLKFGSELSRLVEE
ncbi:hypothetical protein ACHAO9_005826 [Fusarium lateritium]